MAFSASVRDSVVAEINITPLVDVMLVLLVIFMVSAPMIARPLDASLPQQADKAIDTVKPPQLLLEITDDGGYRLDGRQVSWPQLTERLEQIVTSDPETTVSLRASSGADYQVMVRALSATRDSGIAHIAVLP